MIAAVLLTCFNRKEKTLSCLNSIYKQQKIDDLTIKIFLVDDGSTDGTSDAVIDTFPEVNIISGSGNLYWNGGMNLAWRTAVAENFDFFIWLNDDVLLSSTAFTCMFETYATTFAKHENDPVIVGCFSEANGNNHAYGGFLVKKSIWAITKTPVAPGGTIKLCDTFNGNMVLIPNSVVKKIGLLDARFTHSFGDIDYGIRCKANDIPIYITPVYLGMCPRNIIEGSWLDPNVSLFERYRRLTHPTGLPPTEYFYTYRKEGKYLAGSIALVKLFLRLLYPRIWSKLSGNKLAR